MAVVYEGTLNIDFSYNIIVEIPIINNLIELNNDRSCNSKTKLYETTKFP